MNNVELIRLESFSAPSRPAHLLHSVSNPAQAWPPVPQPPASNPPPPTPPPTSSTSTNNHHHHNNELIPSSGDHLKSFSSNFWGEKTIGFDVLCQNLRTSLASVKELEVKLKISSISFLSKNDLILTVKKV